MHDLLEQTFHFDKTASRRRVKGGRLDWEATIHESLSESAPYVIEGGNQIEIEWDEQDPETGFALGKVIVWNRPPLPPVMATQMAAMQQQHIQDPGKAVTIPIHVRGFDLYDPSVFIDTEGHAHALTEKRWAEQMGAPDAFGPLDPNANTATFQNGAPTHGLPSEAAGYHRSGQSNIGGLGGGKFASGSAELKLVEAALGPEAAPLADPYDQERMRKTAGPASVVAGLGRTRVFPAFRFMIAAPSRSLSQYQVDAVDSQPRSIAFVQQTDQPAVGSRGLQFRTTLVGDRYYDPVEHEGDYAETVELLKGLVPDIAQRIAAGGDHVIRLTDARGVSPFVLEDLSLNVSKVLGRGCYFVMDTYSELMRMDAVMNVCEWSGEPSGQKLFIGDSKWAMSIDAVGRLIDGFGQNTRVNVGTVKTGQWVSLVQGNPTDPNAKWMVPCRVIDDTCCGGRRVMLLVTYRGEDLAVMFVPGVARPISADGVKWPDMAQGNARYLVPQSMAVVPLGSQTILEESGAQLEATLQSFVQSRADIAVPARGTVRFTAGAMSDEPYVTLIHNANEVLMGDDWTMRGESLRGVLGDNVGSNMRASQVQFVLAVLGADEDESARLMTQAQSRGQITIGGLRPVPRATNTDGTAKAPYLRKLAELSVHIRDLVPDEERDTLLKAAACVGIANLQEPVREFLADEGNVSKLAFLNSVFEKLAVHGGPEGLVKVGEALADPESIDVMLGLNVVNERNVQLFLSELQMMLDVEDRLAELLLLSRQGLKGVEPDDVEEALRSLNSVNEKLEYLQTQVQQDKLQVA